MKKKFLLLFILCYATNAISFETLRGLQAYSKKFKEFPKPDKSTWLDADYSSYHKSITPTWFGKQLQHLGYKAKTAWNDHFFFDLLNQVIKQRKDFTGRTVATLLCPKGAKLYIWGDLHGAFHSFIRCLTYLHQQNVIDETLKIIKPNHYFIFNGDAIDRSPYSLESLTVYLLLMKKNPDRIIYIRGKHEDKGHWLNFDLKRELQIKATSLSKEAVPLQKEINAFFNTLPLALFVSTPEDLKHVIRISHRDRQDKEIDKAEKLLSRFMQNSTLSIPTHHNIKNNKRSEVVDVQIDAIVKTEPWRHEVKGKTGLAQLEQDEGATSWVILSSPIEAHNSLLDFYYDAFGVITINSPLNQSIITLYNRDMRKPDSEFKKDASYKIVSGIPIYKDKQKKGHTESFSIGSSMALIGGVPTMGQQVKRGMSAHIREANKKEGVKGKHIRTVIYNDDYNPTLTVENIKKLRDNSIDIILLPTGSPTLASYLDLIENKKVLALFPITGGPQFRDPKLKGLVHFRGTYSDEVVALIDYMVGTLKAHKFVFFYQNDAYGLGPLKTAHEALKEKGVKDWVDVPYLRGSTDFKTQVAKIKEALPDAIGFFSTSQATRELMRLLGVNYLRNKYLFGISFLGEEPFRRFIEQHGIKILFGSVVPNPRTSNLPIVKEYRKAMDLANFPYDVFSLEAYIATTILIYALNHIEGPITNDKILEKLESFNNFKLKGLDLTFHPEKRSLSKYIWLESGDNVDWERKPIKYQEETQDSIFQKFISFIKRTIGWIMRAVQ